MIFQEFISLLQSMASSIVQSVLRYYLLNENNLFVAVG